MKLIRALCTTCGSNVDVDSTQKKGVCVACGNTYLVSHALDLERVQIDKTKDLKNHRILLKEAIENSDYETMRHHAKGILEIIPYDFEAQYFFPFASTKAHSPKALERFYKQRNYEATEESVHFVTHHIIHQGDLSDDTLIRGFLNHLAPHKMSDYHDAFEHRKQMEEHYSIIPRDAFICHRSKDRFVAEEVLRLLERDGYRCWISYRNLKPNDNVNYWSNIEAAIENTKVLIVISSQDAMYSKDVQKEMSLAEKHGTLRLEFKIDSSDHTSYFKHFFDGHKWVDGKKDLNQGYMELKSRFFDLMQETKFETVTKDVNTELSPLDNLIKRATYSLSYQDFAKASEFVESALNLNVESGEAWFLKFLADHKFKNEKQFIEYAHDTDELDSLIELMQSQELQMAKKFMPNRTIINDITTVLEERIQSFVEQVTLSHENANSTLRVILKHNPSFDMAQLKLILFHKDIASLDVLIKKLEEEDYFFLEAFFESEEYLEFSKAISDPKVKAYEETFQALKVRLGDKKLDSMRKIRQKHHELVQKIEAQMKKQSFKRALRNANKLQKLDETYVPQATYYRLLCQHSIEDDKHLRGMLRENTKHREIKLMIQNKLFKELEKMERYKGFTETVQSAYNEMKIARHQQAIEAKFYKLKKRYTRFYRWSNFFIGLAIFTLMLSAYVYVYDASWFHFVAAQVSLNTFATVFFSVIFIMVVTMLIRELTLVRHNRLMKKLDKTPTIDFSPLAAIVPLMVLISLVLVYLTNQHAFVEVFQQMGMLDDIITLASIIVVIMIMVIFYGRNHDRSSAISNAIRSNTTIRKLLLRPIYLMVAVVLFELTLNSM